MFQLFLKKILWGAFWLSDLITTMNPWVRGRWYLLKQCVATVPVRISTRGLGRVILGPRIPCTATLTVLIMLFTVSCVVGIRKTPRPNLRVYLGFSVCPLGFSFYFVWYCFFIYSQIRFVIFETFTDVKWRKGWGEKNQTNLSVLAQEWDIPRKKRQVPLGS